MKEERKKGMWRKMDHLLLGVVVGGAVGSILGITLAPKSGRETRQEIAKKTEEIRKRVGNILENRNDRNQRKQGFWHFLNRVFYQKK